MPMPILEHHLEIQASWMDSFVVMLAELREIRRDEQRH